MVAVQEQQTHYITSEEVEKFLNSLPLELKKKKPWIDKEDLKILLWAMVKFARFPYEQPHHLEELDTNLIKMLSAKGYSIGDIAFILDRSKSTIHDYLNRFQLEKETVP